MDFIVHGILQTRIVEWVTFPSPGDFLSQPRDQTQVSCNCRQILYQLSHKGSPGMLEWVAYPFSRRSSQPRNQTEVSCVAGGFFTNWAIREAAAAAAKSLQSCPTPSNPMDCSLQASSVHGIFQARVLEWGAIAFSYQGSWKVLNSTKCSGGYFPGRGNAEGFPQGIESFQLGSREPKSTGCWEIPPHTSGPGDGHGSPWHRV